MVRPGQGLHPAVALAQVGDLDDGVGERRHGCPGCAESIGEILCIGQHRATQAVTTSGQALPMILIDCPSCEGPVSDQPATPGRARVRRVLDDLGDRRPGGRGDVARGLTHECPGPGRPAIPSPRWVEDTARRRCRRSPAGGDLRRRTAAGRARPDQRRRGQPVRPHLWKAASSRPRPDGARTSSSRATWPRFRWTRTAGPPPEGPRPSSDIAIHRAIYRSRPDVIAIVHAHLPASMALTLAGEVPDPSDLPETAFHLPVLPFVPFGEMGSEELAGRVALAFEAQDPRPWRSSWSVTGRSPWGAPIRRASRPTHRRPSWRRR